MPDEQKIRRQRWFGRPKMLDRKKRKISWMSTVWTAIVLSTALAHGQPADYPNRPVRVIAPFAPGGNIDLSARILAANLQERLGQPFVVENKPGAGGLVGAAYAAQSKADGYTILVGGSGITTAPALTREPPLNVETDLVPITMINRSPAVLVVRPDFPAKTLAEFISYAKANPGKINMGIEAASSRLLNLHFNALAGVDTQLIPYKGTSDTVNAILGSQIDAAFLQVLNAKPLVEAEKVRALGTANKEGSSSLPGVPAIPATLPEFDTVAWIGLFVPPGTPQEIMSRLQKETSAILKTPEVRDRMLAMSVDPSGNSTEEFNRIYREDIARALLVATQNKIERQ
jgi:tripartite-type tricarboxylate transporter receptor subunit TctC